MKKTLIAAAVAIFPMAAYAGDADWQTVEPSKVETVVVQAAGEWLVEGMGGSYVVRVSTMDGHPDFFRVELSEAGSTEILSTVHGLQSGQTFTYDKKTCYPVLIEQVDRVSEDALTEIISECDDPKNGVTLKLEASGGEIRLMREQRKEGAGK